MSLSREDLFSPGPDRVSRSPLSPTATSDAIRSAVASAASAAAAAAYHTHTQRRPAFSPPSGYIATPARSDFSPSVAPRSELHETAEVTIRPQGSIADDLDFSMASRMSRDSRSAVATNELLLKSRETIMRLQQELEGERAKVRSLSSELTLAKRELSDEKLSASSSMHGASMAADKETRLLRELGLLKANERVLKAKVEELEREVERMEKVEARAVHLEETLRIREEELVNERDLVRSLQETIRSKDELLKETTVTLCNLDEKLNSQEKSKHSSEESYQKELLSLKVENTRLKAEAKEGAVQLAMKYQEQMGDIKSKLELQLSKLEMKLEHVKDQEAQLGRLVNANVKYREERKQREKVVELEVEREKLAMQKERQANELAKAEHAKQVERMQRMFDEKLAKMEIAAQQGQIELLNQQRNWLRNEQPPPPQQMQYQSPTKQSYNGHGQGFAGSAESVGMTSPLSGGAANRRQSIGVSEAVYSPNGRTQSPVLVRSGETEAAISTAGATNINIKLVPQRGEQESGGAPNEAAQESLKAMQTFYEKELQSLHSRLLALQSAEMAADSDRNARQAELEAKVKKLKVRFAHDQRTIGAQQAEIKALKKKIAALDGEIDRAQGTRSDIDRMQSEVNESKRELASLEDKLKVEIKLRKLAESEMKRLSGLVDEKEEKNGRLGEEKRKLLNLLRGALDAGHRGESLHSGLMKKLEKVIQTVETELEKKENRKAAAIARAESDL